MPTLADIRQQYPQYNDLSDAQLAQGLHQKFYADMPLQTFYDKIGLQTVGAIDPLPARHAGSYSLEEQLAGIEHMKEGGRRFADVFRHPKPRPSEPEPTTVSGELASLGRSVLESVAPESVRAVGEMAGGAAQYVAAPITALYRGVVGEPVRQDVERGALAVGASPRAARMSGEFARNLAETGASFAMPEVKLPGLLGPRAPRPVEAPVMQDGVIYSRGQATGDPQQLAFENRARLGWEGKEAQDKVLAFDRAQEQQAAERTQAVQQSFAPAPQEPPPTPRQTATPREAAELAQQAVTQQAQRADALTDTAFARARGYDTQVEAGIFRGMGAGIRREILEGTEGGERVIIDRSQTPYANAMINDLNRQPEALARRLGQRIAEGQTIAALPLEMVDRIRRSLLGLRRGAMAAARGGRYEDLRASQAVIDAFDARIDRAIDQGLYSGDPAGVQAWKDARRAHQEFRQQFTRFSRDPTSKVMEKVVGGEAAAPLIAEDVANRIYGSNVVNPSNDNVQLARRFQRMLDPQQWATMQEGHFERLLEAGDDLKVANAIDTFLGHTMAEVMYPSAAQRDMLKGYADMRRKLSSKAKVGVPVEAYRLGDRIAQYFGGHIGRLIGHGVGGTVGFAVGGPVGAGIGAAVSSEVGRYAAAKYVATRPAARAARRIERDMRGISNAWVDYAVAAQLFEQSKTPRTIARLTVAVRNLDRNLRSIGTSFQELNTPTPPTTTQDQPAPPQTPPARPSVTLPRRLLESTPLSGAGIPMQP